MAGEPAFAVSTMQVVVHERMEIPGPEDIVIDHAADIAFVASQQRLSATGKLLEVSELPGGAIFALDLNHEPLVLRSLTDQEVLGVPFHPRGCSLYCGEPGVRRLLVISDRAAAEHVVEMFDVDGDRLRPIRTVVDSEHLISPNDMVALDGDRFYVTNDHGASNALLRWLEDGAALVTALPTSTVVFWDGRSCHTVAKEIEFANGIALDPAREQLYVAATRSKKLYAYAWDASNPAKALTHLAEIDLPGCPDNLEWDEEDHLWIGADPSFLKLFLYYVGIVPTAPSLVLRLRFDSGQWPRIEEVWHDDTGEILSASSVAAVHGRGPTRRLLIGQPFGNYLLDCELLTV